MTGPSGLTTRTTREAWQWVAIASLFLLQIFTLLSSSDNGLSLSDTTYANDYTSSRAMRRSLQQTNNTGAPSAQPTPEPTLEPTPEQLTMVAPSPETDVIPLDVSITYPSPGVEPAVEESEAQADTVDSGSHCEGQVTLPREMAILTDIFEWDENRRALIIKANTIDAGGHLIVNGFTGIRQSLFIGGDPNNGESATEISPGSIMLYKAGEDPPNIAGFNTHEEGYELSRIEVLGGLQLLDPDTGKVDLVGS
jgi:hypothetical protein